MKGSTDSRTLFKKIICYLRASPAFLKPVHSPSKCRQKGAKRNLKKIINHFQGFLVAHECWPICPNPFGSADCLQMELFKEYFTPRAGLALQKSRGGYLHVPRSWPGAEAEPKQDPVGVEEPCRGCGKLGCACWGGRTFQKKMIFEPSALFFLLSLQEGKPLS